MCGEVKEWVVVMGGEGKEWVVVMGGEGGMTGCVVCNS